MLAHYVCKALRKWRYVLQSSHASCKTDIAFTAAPFHPKGMPPKASCPKCLRDKGDDTPRSLYGIRGLGEGEYDAMIPSGWLRCPAIKLDSSTAEISAVRVCAGLRNAIIAAANGEAVPIHGASQLLA